MVAEFAPAVAGKLVRKPANVSFQRDAAVPVSGLDLVRSLGADHVVDYLLDDGLAVGERRYDVILDTGGNRSLRVMMLSPFVGQHLRSFVPSENAADLGALADLLESGAVIPAVDRSFPLADTPAAIRYLRRGQAHGKVVIDV